MTAITWSNDASIVYDDAMVRNYLIASGVTLAKGEAVYFDTNGRLVKSNAGAAGTAKFAGIVVEVHGGREPVAGVCVFGEVSGLNLSALAYGASVFLSNTAGGLDTAAGTVSVVAGKVWTGSGELSRQKVLFVNAASAQAL
jgi:hypothetical protein